jgi:hypothetical protein
MTTLVTSNNSDVQLDESESTETIINFFDKLDENELDLHGLCDYLFSLDIFEIYNFTLI